MYSDVQSIPAGEATATDDGARALRHLRWLMAGGVGCTIVVAALLILAALQAVTLIDTAVAAREQVQVERAVAASPVPLNAITLRAMSETLDLDHARLAGRGDVAAGEVSVPLVAGSDRVVAWRPHAFAVAVFDTLAPIRISAGIALILIAAILGWRVIAVGRGLDRRRTAAAHLAVTDPLTGLGNRRAFDTALTARCAARDGEGFVLVFIDLDGFKSINDEYGHAAGDDLLRAVAATLADMARPGDLVARVGGDEFAVLRPGAGLDTCLDSLRHRLGAPVTAAGRTLHVSASIGMARSEDFPDGPAQICQAADNALYRAKRAGSGHAELAAPPMSPRRTRVAA